MLDVGGKGKGGKAKVDRARVPEREIGVASAIPSIDQALGARGRTDEILDV